MKVTKWFEVPKPVHEKSRIKDSKKVLFGTVAVSLGGLLGGLLFLPKSGEKTRNDIISASKDLTKNIKVKTEKLTGKEPKKDKLKGIIDNTITDAKVKISEYLKSKIIKK